MHVLLFFCYIACCIQSVSPWTFQKTFQQSYFDGGLWHAYRRFLGSGTTEERYVLLTGFFFFFIVCVFILCLIFSEAFSAACWWRARRISSIINHLKEVGPTFFFAINIFIFTLCFGCLFSSLFLCFGMEKQAGSFLHQETLEKGMDTYCFA